MERKKLVLGLLILAFAGLGSGLFFFKDKLPFLATSTSLINPISDNQKQEKKLDLKLVWWEDPAGFTFLYPEEAVLDDFPEEESFYAHLELTNPSKKGKITILCSDSKYPDIETWAKEDSQASEGLSLDTQVASMSAKKVALGEGKELVAFIDWDQVIYTIEIDAQEEDYWREVADSIIDSFKLTPLEGETEEDFSNWLEGFDTSQADIVEPVEVIE